MPGSAVQTSPRRQQLLAADEGSAHRLQPVQLTGLCAVVALVTTVFVSLLPFVRFAYQAPELHVALETLAAVVALLVAFLVLGRFRAHRRLQDLLLTLALSIVAVANLLLAGLPNALDLDGEREFSTWAPLLLRLGGTLLLTAAAFTPLTVHAHRGRETLRVTGSVTVVFLIALVALWMASPLPPAIDPAVDLRDAGRPLVVGHPLLLVAQALGALLYGAAALAFTRLASRSGDELLRWLAAACVFAAFARVNYFLFPSLYSEFVYTGDLLRLAFYLLLLVGAAREISSYWKAHSEAAVLEDRRRMARDLHDGLTQELTYIWAQSRQLAKVPDDPQAVDRIGGAASRAIDESRRAIAALTRPMGEPFDLVLQQTLDELATRYDVRVTADLAPDAVVSSARCEALLRIVGEAVRNGVRHGRASCIHVELRDDPLGLRIVDDGVGFLLATARSEGGGFGLTSMRQRAEGLGARLLISSQPERGTEVLVQWS